MPKNILALSGGSDPTPPRTPFVIACELIAKLSRAFSGHEIRIKQLESVPGGRDGLNGRDGKDGIGLPGQDGRDGIDGKDGSKINGIKIVDENLIIFLDGVENNLGIIRGQKGEPGISVKGEKGDPGHDGSKINKIEINNEGNLSIVVDGVESNLGLVKGQDGQDGQSIKGDSGSDGSNGLDGKSISDVKVEKNNLLINYDGEWKNLGKIVGDQGAEGQAGKDGETVIGPKGNDGQSIKGEMGPPGNDGKDGKDGESTKGDPGKDGVDGIDFDSVVLNRLENEISSIRDEISSQTHAPEMTNGELARRIEVLIGKSVKID